MLKTFLGTVQSPFPRKHKSLSMRNKLQELNQQYVLARKKKLGSKPTSVVQSQTDEIWTSLPSNQTGSQNYWTKPNPPLHQLKHTDGNQSTPTQQLDKALHTKIVLMCLGKYTAFFSPQISSQERDDATSCKLKKISESTQLHKSTQP